MNFKHNNVHSTYDCQSSFDDLLSLLIFCVFGMFQVLMYGSASVAEEVCHLNRWDQCSLPLNALETALELRQLDTVSFFLRNRGQSMNDSFND